LKDAKLKHKIDSDFQVWQEGFYPKQIIGDDMMIQKITYIHMNPVKRGYVDKPEDWCYSSTRNYSGLEGLVPVTLYRR
jgi:REP element-mobilizing transposase RayT